MNWNLVLEFSQKICLSIGRELIDGYSHVEGEVKFDGTLVTEADKRSDAGLQDAIDKVYPNHGILTEEGENAIFPDKEWCWVLDPVDGTNNFARGMPIWGISMGLLYQGTPVFGHVSFPAFSRHYHGFYLEGSGLEGPKGAFLNGKAITTRNEAPDRNQLFCCCSRSIAAIQNFPCKVRVLGSGVFDFVSVASGISLGSMESTPKVWDIAGAYPIVKAAGAQWTFLKDNPFPLVPGQEYISASFPSLLTAHADLEPQFMPFAQKLVG